MTSQRRGKRRRTAAAVTIASALVAGIGLMLTNSPLGAYILLDYLADDDSGLVADPAAGPLELSEFVTAVAAVHAMPRQIDQPSRMTYLEADRAFAIVTDQSELFVVSDDFSMVPSTTVRHRSRARSRAYAGHRERRADLGGGGAGPHRLLAAGSQLGRSTPTVAGSDAGLIARRVPIRLHGSVRVPRPRWEVSDIAFRDGWLRDPTRPP